MWKNFVICQLMTSIVQQNCQTIERLTKETSGRRREEGPDGVKWELGLAGFYPGKMGFKPLGLGFGQWELE